VTGSESAASEPEDLSLAQDDHAVSLPGSDASAIPVDHDDPLAAAGPLDEAPGVLREADLHPEPLIHEDPTAAAFFDLDNTVIQGASLFQLGKGLYRRGFFPTRVIVKGLWLQIYFRMVGQEKPGHIEDARSVILGFIEGHTVAELTEISNEVYEESIAERIWPGTRALAQLHLDVGLVGHRRAGGGSRGHCRPTRADRRLGHHGRAQGRRLYRPVAGPSAPRSCQGGGRTCAGT
jgi:haloacid dehalogenase-like hydrolase